MAQKQKKRKSKRGALRTMLFYVLFPVLVWFGAFLLWFYWQSLTRLFGQSEPKTTPTAKTERKADKNESGGTTPANRSQEKLSDEDRKKLDEILKRRQ